MLGRKKLLLDFTFFYFWTLLCPVPFCEFSGLFWWEDAPFIMIIQSRVLVKSQLTQLDFWLRSDIARNPLLKMSQKLKHQLRSNLLQMTCASAVLGCCRKTSVRSVTMHAVAWNMLKPWQHYLRMAAIPEGSWSRCDWRARCCPRWGSCKSLQELSRVHGRVLCSFFFMMGHDWEVVLWYSYTVICVFVESQLAQLAELDIAAVSSIARNPLLKPLQKLKHQPRSKLRQMNCVLAVLEEKVV